MLSDTVWPVRRVLRYPPRLHRALAGYDQYALKYLLSNHSNLKYIPVVVFAGSAVLKQITSNVPVILYF